jgi:hypothetical protein
MKALEFVALKCVICFLVCGFPSGKKRTAVEGRQTDLSKYRPGPSPSDGHGKIEGQGQD